VGYTVAHVVAELRMKLISALLNARWDYFVSQPAGRFANAIGIESWRAAEAYYELTIAAAYLIQVLVYTAAAVLVSWKVAAAAFGAGLIIMFLLKNLVKIGRRAGLEQTELIKEMVSRLTDALHGIKPIKAMAGEDHLLPLLEAETRSLNLAQRSQVFAKETLKAVQEPVAVLFLAVGMFALITLGDEPFSVIMILAFVFYRMVTRFTEVQHRYQKMATLESAFWSLTESIERAEAASETARGQGRRPVFERGIRFENVFFRYGEKSVLNGVSLEIPTGGFVGIAGASGAGKTTIADLIIGLAHPQQGDILIDDVSLAEIDLTAWRKQVGYVPQEMFLFHDTIYNNVVLGDTSISRAEVEEAIRAAGAREFVSRLPDGMDTVIGERGGRISGGERQRIAIATALVRKPKLLVLDEVTTALDSQTEAEICATLRNLSGKVTIVAISHQPALMNEVQTLYRIEAGRVERQF
jgi:ATP-binding cassette subfamily C protein